MNTDTTTPARVPSPHQFSPDPRPDEMLGAWTDRLAREGAAIGVFRQCSIGWHDECSTRGDGPDAECRCTCHLTAFTWEQEEILDRFEEKSDAPESFDARQALLRVQAVADRLDEDADSADAIAQEWGRANYGHEARRNRERAETLREAAEQIRAALREPATLLPLE